MRKFVGFCIPSAWGPPDVHGVLLEEHSTGWVIAAEHISSNESFAKVDIERNYLKVVKEGDSFEWAGSVPWEEASKRWPPADHVDGEDGA